MKAQRDYLRHAEECEALARTAVSDEQRQMIVKMAETWRLLAKQRERQLSAKAKVEAIDLGVEADEGKSIEATASKGHDMSRKDGPLSFPTTNVAWSELSRSLTFMGTDGGPGAAVEVSISAECLTTFFPVDGEEVPDLVRSFQKHRPMIEKIAALTYEAKNRRRTLTLDTADVEAAMKAIMAVRRPQDPSPEPPKAT